MVLFAARRKAAVQLDVLSQLYPPRPYDGSRELRGLLASYRWRLAFEGLARYVVRGLIAGGLLVTAASGLTWLAALSIPSVAIWLALLLPIGAALLVAAVRWPSHARAARAVDRRLGLEERLGTAIELTGRGRFDRLQMEDAIARLRSTTPGWPRQVASRRELALGLGTVALAIGSLLLPLFPRPTFTPAADVAPPVDAAAIAEERVIPPDVLDMRSLGAAVAEEQAPDANLAPRVQAAQAQQESLDNLAQALSDVSASKGAADAIQRGDYASARDQLNTLAEEADQLSDAAKKQLSRALANAAASSGADRQLADRERQAAQALGRSNYADQRQALQQLAEQVARSGARSMSPSQLARDTGRLQQQQASSGASGASAQSNGMQAQQQQAAGTNGQLGGQSGQGQSAGEQGGPGAGSGSVDGVGGPTGRLETSGQLVEVPTKLSSGPGERPPSGAEDQTGANPGMGGRNVVESAQTQHTGQITPEQNLVPSEQRPVVRGYFR